MAFDIYPSTEPWSRTIAAAMSLLSPLWNHGCKTWIPSSSPCSLTTAQLGGGLENGLQVRRQFTPSFSAMFFASFGSSTILPTLPVKSMATRDRTDSCGCNTPEIVAALSNLRETDRRSFLSQPMLIANETKRDEELG